MNNELEILYEQMLEEGRLQPRPEEQISNKYYFRIGSIPKKNQIVLTTNNILDLMVVWGTVFGGDAFYEDGKPMSLVRITGDIIPSYKSYKTGTEQYILDETSEQDKKIIELKKKNHNTKFYLEHESDYPFYTFDMNVFLIKIETVEVLDKSPEWDQTIYNYYNKFKQYENG